MVSSPIIVGLLWHSVRSDNLGVGALTISQIAIVEAVAAQLGARVRFVVIGWRDPGPCYVQRDDLEVVALRTRHFADPRQGFAAAVRRCDVILDIGAGDSFSDIYGAARFLKLLVAKLLVLAAGRPLVLSPQTIGPFRAWWTRRLAAPVLHRARWIVTRDRLSTALLAELGIRERVVEATDVAFRLPYSTPERPDDGRMRVGINISGLLFSGGYTRDNMFGLAADYPALARGLVDLFAARPDCEVHLISHVAPEHQPVEDDHRVATCLAGEFPNVIVAPRFRDPCAAKTYIARMDFFCGSRMHACIAAFSAGVPVVPIAYSPKFVGLFGTLGYPEVADCQTANTERVLAIVSSAFERRDELRDRIATGLAEASTRLARYEQVLEECLRQAAGGRA